MSDLKNLTKEDLIKIIANMHDHGRYIDWVMLGLTEKEDKTVVTIGELCVEYCLDHGHDFSIPKI
jgi:hypothetical protein